MAVLVLLSGPWVRDAAFAVSAQPGAVLAGQVDEAPITKVTEVARFHRFLAGNLGSTGVGPNAKPEDRNRVALLKHWFDREVDFPLGNGNLQYGGLVHVNRATGRLYQFYTLGNAANPNQNQRIGLLVRSLAKPTQIIAAFLLPTSVGTNLGAMTLQNPDRGELPHAIDEARHRMYFWIESGTTAGGRSVLIIDETKLPDGDKGTTPTGAFTEVPLDDVNATTQAITNFLIGGGPVSPVPDPRWTQSSATPFQGITFANDKLYIVLGSPDDPTGGPATTRYRLLQVNADTLTIDWDRFVRGCERVFDGISSGRNLLAGWAPVLRTSNALWVPCEASGSATVVRIPLASAADPAGEERVFRGNGIVVGYFIDPNPDAPRIHFRIKTQVFDSILTFDVNHGAFVGQQAVTSSAARFIPAMLGVGINRTTGQVFSQTRVANPPTPDDLGLGVLNGRANPVVPPSPNLLFGSGGETERVKILPTDPDRGRVFVVDANPRSKQHLIVVAVPPPPLTTDKPDPDANTLDVNEGPLTDASVSTATSGYGLRNLLVGGFAGAIPARVLDHQQVTGNRPEWQQCHDATRDFAFGLVNDARLSGSLRTANAVAFDADEATRIDVEQPSRCTLRPGAEQLTDPIEPVEADVCSGADVAPWAPGLVQSILNTATNRIHEPLGKPPAEANDPEDAPPSSSFCDVAREAFDDVAGRPWPFATVGCTPEAPQQSTAPQGSLANPENHVLTGFRAQTDCSAPGVVTAASVAEPADTPELLPAPPPGLAGMVPSVTVGHASSSVTSRVAPDGGVVARSESIVRDLTITLPSGQGVITIGGAYALAETTAKGRPDTARSTFRRALWGVTAVGVGGTFTQEIAANEQQMAELAAGLNRILGDRGEARVPKPDELLAKGTPRGYQAALQLDEFDTINRQVVNGDNRKEIPAFEIVLSNESVNYGRQRQIFQLAGVLSNAQYGIGCTGGAKPRDHACVLDPVPPGSIDVSLIDEKGSPLPGSTFAAIGTGGGSCVTGGDGHCPIDDLPPGSYTVKQSKAPSSYQAAPQVTVSVPPGGEATARFVNLRAVGLIKISLADAATGDPLGGGSFAVASSTVSATCTTDASGACLLKQGRVASDEVPLGVYTVQQTEAPSGYEPVPDVVEVLLEEPGQVAELEFTNGTNGTIGSEVAGSAAIPFVTAGAEVSEDRSVSGSPFDSLADLFNWIRRNVGEALLFAASLILFGTPFYASYRRRLLIEAEHPPIIRHG